MSCKGHSVTTNGVGADYAVFNGPATYITLVERSVRPQEVRLELPRGWNKSMTALELAADGEANHFLAPDFGLLADSAEAKLWTLEISPDATDVQKRHFSNLMAPSRGRR